MFHIPKPSSDHVGSVLALVLLLGTWVVGYVALNPADPVQRHTVHLAQVAR